MISYDIWADFNDTNDNVVATLERFARPGVNLAIGEQLIAGDGEGTTCRAEVVSVDKGIVRLRLKDVS